MDKRDKQWAIETMRRNLQPNGMLTFVPVGRSYRVLVASHGANAALGGVTDITDGVRALGMLKPYTDKKCITPQQVAQRLGMWMDGDPDLYTYTTMAFGRVIRVPSEGEY